MKKEKIPKIEKLPSGSYRAQVYLGKDENGKKLVLSHTSKEYNEVVKWCLEAKENAREASERKDNPLSMTFREAITMYVNHKSAVLSPTTTQGYRRARDNAFKAIVDRPICSVTLIDIQKSVNEEAKDHSPKTVHNYWGVFKTSAEYAGWRGESPTLPMRVNPDIKIPTKEEMQHLLSSCEGNDIYLPVLIASCVGLRRGEVCGLEWRDYDRDKKTLSVRRSVVVVERETIEKTTKTASSKRTVLLIDKVCESLNSAYDSKKENGNEPKPNEKIVKLTPDALERAYSRACKKSGITGIHFHALRHYVVSVMLSLNIPKKYIADYVGHETEKMIDTVYGHIMSESQRDYQQLFSTYMSGVIL